MKYILLILILLISHQSMACRCMQRSFEEHTEDSDMIFSGEVIAIEELSNQTKYTFRIEKSWKGEWEEETIVISTPKNSCHVDFNLHDSHILFAKNQTVTLCSKITEAGDEETQRQLADYFKEKD